MTTKSEMLELGRKAYLDSNFIEAMAIWKPLAESGDVEAQSWIGSLYANGDGVEVNDEVAFAWYLRAAEGGSAPAQNNVAAMQAYGRGTSQDDVSAVKWFSLAAEAGDSNAQFNLAVFCASGRGVAQDVPRAMELYRAAATAGHRGAQARLGGLLAGTGNESRAERVEAFVWLFLASQHGVGTALNALDALVRKMSAEEKTEAVRRADAWRRGGNQDPATVTMYPVPA